MPLPSSRARRTAASPRAAILRAPLALAALVLGAAACGGDNPGAPAAPASVEVAPAPTTATAGLPVATAPTFVVKDVNGAPVGGVPVTITVTAGGGSLTGAPTATAAGGPTSVGTWTLGQTVGENTLSIAVAGLAPQSVSIGGVAGAPASVAVVSGGNQTALAGRTLAAPVVFQVRDQFANGVGGVEVSYTAGGGGAVAATVATTSGDGTVTAPEWTVGKSAVPQALHARAGTVVGTATAGVRTDFGIDVRFTSATMTEAQKALFTNAAARLRAILTGDLPNVNATGFNPNLANTCGLTGQPVLAEEIDDVLIYASIQPIDGPSGTLAQAGPCGFRQTPTGNVGLPVIGVMQFDVADVDRLAGQGNLQDVIMHEMMHVLGFGSGYFRLFGFVSNFDQLTVAYSGPRALAGCRGAGGTVTCASTVPLENTGGPGTANSHWRESVFGAELMTGYANAGVMPISAMTAGAFQDIGYQVNYDAMDFYSIPGGSLRASSASRPARIGGEGWERSLPSPGVVIVAPGVFEPIPGR